MNYEHVKTGVVLPRFDTKVGARRFDRLARSAHKDTEPTRVRLLPAQLLATEELLAITDGVATTVRIDSGEVWITEEGSFIDHILSAGQHYTIDRSGRAIVAAQKASRISLYAPTLGVPPRSVERSDPRRGTQRRLFARSRLLSAIASLMPLWARRPAIVA